VWVSVCACVCVCACACMRVCACACEQVQFTRTRARGDTAYPAVAAPSVKTITTRVTPFDNGLSPFSGSISCVRTMLSPSEVHV
jgi:hypothetical protein